MVSSGEWVGKRAGGQGTYRTVCQSPAGMARGNRDIVRMTLVSFDENRRWQVKVHLSLNSPSSLPSCPSRRCRTSRLSRSSLSPSPCPTTQQFSTPSLINSSRPPSTRSINRSPSSPSPTHPRTSSPSFSLFSPPRPTLHSQHQRISHSKLSSQTDLLRRLRCRVHRRRERRSCPLDRFSGGGKGPGSLGSESSSGWEH